MANTYINLGACGHARGLVEYDRNGDMVQIHRILDPDQNRWGQTMLKVPILGGDQLTARVAEECLRNLVIGSGNAGVSGAKRCPFEMVQAHGPEPLTVIKSACIHSPRAVIDKGVAIRQGIVIGESAIVGACCRRGVRAVARCLGWCACQIPVVNSGNR